LERNDQIGRMLLAAILMCSAASAAPAQPSGSSETPVHVMGVVVGPGGGARIYCRTHVGMPVDIADPVVTNRIARGLFEPVGDLSSLRWNDQDVFVAPRALPEKGGGPSAPFDVDYSGFSSEARSAFQYAVDLLSMRFVSNVTIRVEASWTSLDEHVLGTAGPTYFDDADTIDDPNEEDAWFVPALANAMRGADDFPQQVDVVANFNSDFDNWYFGLDGQTPSGMVDFVTVVLHEIGHGVGFLGSMKIDDGTDGAECDGTVGEGCWGFVTSQYAGVPVIFDRFAEDPAGNSLINTTIYPKPSAALAGALQGGGVRFAGEAAVAAYAGARPPLYAPLDWDPGSSYSHLDEATFGPGDPSALMTPAVSTSEAVHDPGPIGCAVFADLGWTMAPACGTVSVPAVPAAPVVPEILHPSDGDVNIGIPATFSWSEAVDADFYDVQVARDSAFTQFAVDSSLVDTTHLLIHTLEPATRYFWRVRAINDIGDSVWTVGAEFMTEVSTAREDVPGTESFGFRAAFPNPFHDRITLDISLPRAMHVRLTIYDLRGRFLAVIVDERLEAGSRKLRWRPLGLPSGVYLCRLEGGGRSSTRKIVYIHVNE
jgi:hypothetical protein